MTKILYCQGSFAYSKLVHFMWIFTLLALKCRSGMGQHGDLISKQNKLPSVVKSLKVICLTLH